MLLAKMPFASLEYSACWMTRGSAPAESSKLLSLFQYRITMEMEAAPQASLSCLTNGTSSQIPGGPVATPWKARLKKSANSPAKRQGMEDRYRATTMITTIKAVARAIKI